VTEAARAGSLRALMAADQVRWRLLGAVRALDLPDCWIGAGFVRNAVWDRLHGRPAAAPSGDVDVVWFDRDRACPEEDRALEAALRAAEPAVAWSVKNQARMHARNGDPPYVSASDAMRHWPETATAVAVRRTRDDGCEIAAPLGLDDLFACLLRPGPRFLAEKRSVFADRVESKGWLKAWPLSRLADGPGPG
jgi:hypothetical protein